METDVSSLHRDVDFLLAQLGEALDAEGKAMHFDASLDVDYNRQAVAVDGGTSNPSKHSEQKKHKSKYEQEREQFNVKKKEGWFKRIGSTFMKDTKAELLRQIVGMKSDLYDLEKFLDIHPGNANGEEVGEEYITEALEALDELRSLLLRPVENEEYEKKKRRGVGGPATDLKPDEIEARNTVSGKLATMERFADDLFNDREEKELERFNEKREKERMEVERLAMVKEEIRKLQSKRIISCLDKVAQADVDFDVPQYPCYVMRLSTLLEKGEEIAALEHEKRR